MLHPNHLGFFLSRSYTKSMVEAEGLYSLSAGYHEFHGCQFKLESDCVCWPCFSMAGTPIGLQTRAVDKHEYRWHQAIGAQHLPIIYGTAEDHEIFFRTGKAIFTEGAFDRAAIKRCFPHYAVYGRLSKGLGKHLTFFVKRYGKLIWLAFDQDEPGQKAANRAQKLLKPFMEVEKLAFPYKDPSLYIEKRGIDTMRRTLSAQVNALDLDI